MGRSGVKAVPEEAVEALEQEEGASRAAAARAVVGEQVAALLEESELTGGKDLFSQRLQAVIEAAREGERGDVRAAVMDVTVAAAAWCVALDLGQ